MIQSLIHFVAQPLPLAVFGIGVGLLVNWLASRLPRSMEIQWWHDVAEHLDDAVAHEQALGAGPRAVLAAGASAIREQLIPRDPRSAASRSWRPLPEALVQACDSVSSRGGLLRPSLLAVCTALLFAALGVNFQGEPAALLRCVVAAVLLLVGLIDWDTLLLPDSLTLPLLWAGLLAASLGWTLPVTEAVWGAVAGYMALWLLYWIIKVATGQEALGFGDFKLLAALGAWFGIEMLTPLLFAASLTGAIAAVVMKYRGGLRHGRYVPFGPFLAASGVATMFGEQALRGSLISW